MDDSGSDFDGDGITLADELIAGTDPSDSDSDDVNDGSGNNSDKNAGDGAESDTHEYLG